MPTPDLETVQLFGIALLIGALLGVEREKKKADTQKPSFAGIRTFMLLSETGALAAWLSVQNAMPAIFVTTLIGLLILIAAAYLLEKRADAASIGITTELAGLSVFLLGAAVMFGQVAIAVGLAVTNTALLALKDPLHGAIQKLGKDDIFAGLKLLIASFIVLPLLPQQAVDPWAALNPYKLWLLVVLISALSLVGYLAMRWLGSARGVAVTGLTGGLVSSTAVTLSLARESRSAADPARQLDDAYAAGVLIAWSVMFVRVLAMVTLFNAALLRPLLAPFAAMLLVNAALAGWYYHQSLRDMAHQIERVGVVPLKNPFSLWAATKFGLLFAVVLLLVELARRSFSASGLIYVAVLAGMTDVDAITLSMVDFARAPEQLQLAAYAVVAAVWANTLVKAALTLVLGSRGTARRVCFATVVMLVLGGAVLLV
ncbi:MgtC/SapB family protein [Uliginosibacterium sp. IMCC34675]|uniref:MgtC/SapB family protein n=1 Tax=Uliginosibacterium aquaticum TaxID=2731212 RepID=A0ABX2IIE1_9RHOO|nr:MgtC/SapB family protein [Uliginosibacterium aquaticum]